MTERTIVDMGIEPMARVIDYLRSCVEGQIESVASAIQEGEPQHVLIALTHNFHLLFSEYQRALNGTMKYGMAMSWWEQIEMSEIEEGKVMGNMGQEGTIMEFDVEARKTIMAELIVRLEGEILDLRDILQADIPEMLEDRWIPSAEVSKKAVNVSIAYGGAMAKLLGWMKEANYGTMTLETAERLYSPNDYRW